MRMSSFLGNGPLLYFNAPKERMHQLAFDSNYKKPAQLLKRVSNIKWSI